MPTTPAAVATPLEISATSGASVSFGVGAPPPPPPPAPTITLSSDGAAVAGTAEAITVTAANLTGPLTVTMESVSGPSVSWSPTTVAPAPGELVKLSMATWAAAGTAQVRGTAPGGIVSNTLTVPVSPAPPPPPPPPAPYDVLIDEIATFPAESWTRINAGRNTFQDIWPPLDLRAEYGFGSGNPSAWHRIMGAWGGFGWNPVLHELWKIGGGHANSAANGVAGWRVADRDWVLGFHDSRPLPVIVSNDRYRSIDFQSTPISVHTYGNNNFLPILQRFVSLGGACHGDGGPWRVYDTGIPGNQSPLRVAACYTLDVSQAGQGMVAGETGSNEKRGAFAGVDLDGANAWELRDWWAKAPGARPTFFGVDFSGRINFGTAYLEYNGHDALLYTSSSGTNASVLLVEFVDNDGDNDLHYLVGGWDGDGEGQGQVAYADGPQIFLKSRNGGTASNCYRFVDLKRTWGTGNNWRSPTITGPDLAEFLAITTTENPGLTDSGIHWNPIKGCFTIHFNRPQIWELYPPAGNPTPDTGWSLVKPTMAAAGPTGLPRSTQGTGTIESHAGVIGQVKWCPDLNCAIKIEGNTAGAVWLYKPTGWTDPR